MRIAAGLLFLICVGPTAHAAMQNTFSGMQASEADDILSSHQARPYNRNVLTHVHKPEHVVRPSCLGAVKVYDTCEQFLEIAHLG